MCAVSRQRCVLTPFKLVCVVEIKSSDNLVGVRAGLDCLFDLSRIGQKLNEKLNMLFACLSGS